MGRQRQGDWQHREGVQARKSALSQGGTGMKNIGLKGEGQEQQENYPVKEPRHSADLGKLVGPYCLGIFRVSVPPDPVLFGSFHLIKHIAGGTSRTTPYRNYTYPQTSTIIFQ